ncbi:methyl-accepting chemotaxis protein [Bacillus gobiensis]|uniref:HAMP domain-containing methyl-accepting chemotaxis protein n=1 Tax=Bacillus gobiensis TaxID=1441095 RepID=UPI003D196F92
MRKFIKWLCTPSISRKLSIAFLLVLTLPIILLALGAFHTASKSLEEEMMRNANNSVKSLDRTIQSDMETKVAAIKNFSNWINKDSFKEENLNVTRQRFEQYKSLNSNIESIYSASSKGDFIRFPDIEMPDDFNPTERNWYKSAMANKGKYTLTDPYQTASTGLTVVTIAMANLDGSGVVAINIPINYLSQVTEGINIGKSGYAFIVNENMQYISHPTETVGGTVEKEISGRLAQNKNGHFDFDTNRAKERVIFETNAFTGWKIAGIINTNEIAEASEPLFNFTMILFIGSVLVGGVIIFTIIHSIRIPLKKLVASAAKISNGDLSEKIEIRSKDEIGQLSQSFNSMAESLRNVIGSIQLSVDNLASSSEELTASAQQTSKATEHITLSIEQFSGGNETQSENVEKSSEQLDRIDDGLQRIAKTSSVVAESSIKSIETAESGGQLVRKNAGQMKLINDTVKHAEQVIKGLEYKSKDINKIVGTINGIADQTNLLSLNAAIESARAGEYGRGFSVVAEEVRKLAARSSESSKVIEKMIHEIITEINGSLAMFQSVNQEVSTGLDISTQTEESFKEIQTVTNEIAEDINQMNVMVSDLSEGSKQVSTSVRSIAQISKESAASIQDIAASAEEQLASMEEISASSTTLATMAEELRELTKKFNTNKKT